MFKSKAINKTLLIIILLAGAILRLYNIGSFSITADEVSAINRAQFSSIEQLLQLGVCTDTHPAGVQLFLFFWIKLFGISELAVRLPFVVAGILSVLFIYLIGKSWFGETAGLLAAAALGFLEYPITYSQLARPYSPGLLFCLVTVFFWTKFLFEKKHKNQWYFWGFVMSVTFSIYTHYISALVVLIVSTTGLFFLTKENYKTYLGTGLCILILFLPHVKIFLIQLGMGGVGGPDGWLSKPSPDFITNYLSYAANHSSLVIILFLSLFVLSFFTSIRNLKWNRFHIICIVWFVLTYSICYLYSVYINPLLQYSVLLFSFPFLLLFLFSLFNTNNDSLKLIGISLFSIVIIYSTVFQNKLYSTHRFGVLKEIAEGINEYDTRYGSINITRTINLVGPYSIHYYFSKNKQKPVFASYMNSGHAELKEFSILIDSASTDYFSYAWSTKYSPPEIPEMIAEKYPALIEKDWFYNSEIYLFGKQGKTIETFPLYLSKNTFEAPLNYWSVSGILLNDSVSYEGEHSILLNPMFEYGPTFKAKVKDIISSVNNIIHISLYAKMTEENSDAQIVLSFERDGKSYDWHSNNFSFFNANTQHWKKVFLSLRMPENILPEDDITIYVWNNLKTTIFIDDMQVKVTEGNPLAYGKRKEFVK